MTNETSTAPEAPVCAPKYVVVILLYSFFVIMGMFIDLAKDGLQLKLQCPKFSLVN